MHRKEYYAIETFKMEPEFAEKLEDFLGLDLNPTAHALMLCVDEKSQIRAWNRTQPGLPLKRGRSQTMTHNYKRNRTATLFADLMYQVNTQNPSPPG